MKKLLMTSIAVFSSFFLLHAQSDGAGFEFGVRGAVASNWLFNSNTDQGGMSSLAAAVSYNYGVQVAYNFNEKCAIEVNLLMGTITQGYTSKFGTNDYLEYQPNNPSSPNPNMNPLGSLWSQQPIKNQETSTSSVTLNVTGIPVLFRFGSGTGSYFEIGPEYQMINGATYTVNYSNGYPPPSAPVNYSNYNVSGAWAKSNIQGVIGFGNDFQIGESGWNIITDIRFYYGLTDLIGCDAHGQYFSPSLPNGSTNELYTANYPNNSGPFYSGYKRTNSAGASFNLGIYYFIPLGSTSGHGRCKHAPSVKSH